MAVVPPARLAAALLGLACLGAVGCGARSARFADTVEGTLTAGKTPLVGVRVQFVPQVEPGVRAPLSSATTDEKGFFRLTRDDTGKPGAALGKHKVVLLAGRVSAARSRDDDEGARSGSAVPKAYTNLATTPLEVEVKEGQTTYPLEVK